MKEGSIVQYIHQADNPEDCLVGLVISIADDFVVPPICHIMWSNSSIKIAYFDELEVIEC